MKIIIMYDLPMDDDISRKEYQKFHKNILKRGYTMMQYSIYFKTISAITKIKYEEKYLEKILPSKGNIRRLVVTENQFYNMKTLRGSRSLNESVNNAKRYVLIDENLWE